MKKDKIWAAYKMCVAPETTNEGDVELVFLNSGEGAITRECLYEYFVKMHIDPCLNGHDTCGLSLMNSRELYDHIVFPSGVVNHAPQPMHDLSEPPTQQSMYSNGSGNAANVQLAAQGEPVGLSPHYIEDASLEDQQAVLV